MSHMKIAVLTRRFGYNFGSSLQAYAIKKMLESFADSVHILNYDEFSAHPSWYVKPWLKKNFGKNISKFFPNANCSKKFISNYMQEKKFNAFDQKYICSNRRILRTSFALRKETKKYDCIVCGSDQIWNPKTFDKNYFLAFTKNSKIRKVSYATSFGVPSSLRLNGKIRKYLNDFFAISVREDDGCKIVKNNLGKDVPSVLDPTLMIPMAEWRQLEKEIEVPNSYILCYFLENLQPEQENVIHEFIQSLKNKTSLPIVNITTPRYHNLNDEMQLNLVGPQEFLYAIRNASYVITNSYHASIFSILNEKEFFVFPKHLDSFSSNENSRFYSLLKKIGLLERLVKNLKVDLLNCKIDYKSVYEKLNVEKEMSCKYLRTALEKF